MELRAVFEAVRAAPPSSPLLIQTDSKYVIQIYTEWLETWEANNWLTGAKKPVANQKAIEILRDEIKDRDIKWHHVRGHAGHEWNEMADRLAKASATAIRDGRTVQSGNPGCIKEKLALG